MLPCQSFIWLHQKCWTELQRLQNHWLITTVHLRQKTRNCLSVNQTRTVALTRTHAALSVTIT